MRLTLPSGHAPTAAEWSLLLSYLQPLYVRKTADEALTSNTTLQNDDELLLSVEASAEYQMFAFVIYSAGTTERIKYTFTGPSGATLDWTHGGPDSTVTTAAGVAWWGTSTIGGSGNTAGAAGTGTSLVLRPTGILRTSTTAGTLQFQWAQNTSGLNATTVKTGSFLILRRLS